MSRDGDQASIEDIYATSAPEMEQQLVGAVQAAFSVDDPNGPLAREWLLSFQGSQDAWRVSIAFAGAETPSVTRQQCNDEELNSVVMHRRC